MTTSPCCLGIAGAGAFDMPDDYAVGDFPIWKRRSLNLDAANSGPTSPSSTCRAYDDMLDPCSLNEP